MVAVLSGCLKDNLVPCGDSLCPNGYTCDVEAVVCVDPHGLSLPNQLEIPAAACGATTTQQITIKNFADHAISYSAISDVPGVTVIPAHGTFAAGAETQVAIAANIPTASVPGQALTGAVLFELDGQDVLRRSIAVTPAGALLDISAHTLSFGEAAIGDTATKLISITNQGNSSIGLDALLGAQVPSDGSFATPNTNALRLDAGVTSRVAVTFFPHTLGGYTSKIAFAPDGPLCQASLDPVNLDGAATNEAILVDSLHLDFGDVGCGGTGSAQQLLVTNKNATPQSLVFELSGPAAAFFQPIPSQIVMAGNAISIPIRRLPIPPPQDVVGAEQASLKITATGATTTVKTIELKMNLRSALLRIVEDCVPIDTVAPHSVAMANMTVANTGNATAAVTVTTAAPATVSPSAFQVPAGGSTPMTVLITNNFNAYMDLPGVRLGTLFSDASCTPSVQLVTCGGPL